MKFRYLMFSLPNVRCPRSLIVIAFLVLSSRSYAQRTYIPVIPPKDTSMFLFFKDVTAGPYFTGGITRQNTSLPGNETDPWHSESGFSYSLGAELELSVNEWVGLAFTALYDARDIYLANRGDNDNLDFSVGYLSFQPAVRLAWLLVGLAFEMPMAGNATQNVASYYHSDQPVVGAPPTAQKYAANLDVDTKDLATITELRATLQIPILQSENGMINLIISGSYPLSAALSTKTPAFDTTGQNHGAITPDEGHVVFSHFSNNFAPAQGPLPSIQAGITYQFDILH
jgi:hypothetical protein